MEYLTRTRKFFTEYNLRTQIANKRNQLKERNASLDLADLYTLDITEIAFASVSTLSARLKENSLSCHQLMTVCVSRSLALGRPNHWTADTLYAEALEEAKACDVAIAEARENGTLDELFR